MDIETAADLRSKSGAKLAKSRGITHTLVSEAINSEKSWVEIKDLLCLKLCNANIHTHPEKNFTCHIPGILKRTATYKRMADFSLTLETVNRRQQ